MALFSILHVNAFKVPNQIFSWGLTPKEFNALLYLIAVAQVQKDTSIKVTARKLAKVCSIGLDTISLDNLHLKWLIVEKEPRTLKIKVPDYSNLTSDFFYLSRNLFYKMHYNALILLSYIHMACGTNNECTISDTQITEAIGLNQNTITKYKKDLVSKNYITIDKYIKLNSSFQYTQYMKILLNQNNILPEMNDKQKLAAKYFCISPRYKLMSMERTEQFFNRKTERQP